MMVFTLRLLLLCFLFCLQNHHQEALGADCSPTRCSTDGPEIYFPFWLKDRHPEHCGASPAFSLFCSATNHTILINSPFLASTGEVFVTEIKYQSLEMEIGVGSPAAPTAVCLNLSSPFSFRIEDGFSYTGTTLSLFHCPTNSSYHLRDVVSCLSSQNHTVVAYYANSLITTTTTTRMRACRKISQNVQEELQRTVISSGYHRLKWYYQYPPGKDQFGKDKKSNDYLFTGLSVVAAILIVALCYSYRTMKAKKDDEVMVERFLKDYKALKPTRYTYSEIKKITNNFIHKLGQGGYGTVYKGKLSSEVYVAAKILNNSSIGKGDEFLNEVGTIGTIHHINVVRLVGYCADGFRRALVYEFLPNDSLEKFISSPDRRKRSLSWDKLQDIALGIGKGIEYLHQGCDQQILHFDIKPQNILLDENFNPKVADFGMAKLCSKDQSAVSMTIVRGTIGYIAPEVISRNFGKVSHKSDVYSFGMLLLEMAGGRKKPEIKEDNDSEIYFPEWIYSHLNRDIEEVAIEIEDDQGGEKIVKTLMTVGLWCIQWTPGDRPSMKAVVQMLEGDGDTLPMPPNPFLPRNPGKDGTLNSLEVISECESETLD